MNWKAGQLAVHLWTQMLQRWVSCVQTRASVLLTPRCLAFITHVEEGEGTKRRQQMFTGFSVKHQVHRVTVIWIQAALYIAPATAYHMRGLQLAVGQCKGE